MIGICHMTSAHDPEDVRIFHKECVSLARAGYEVYLVERGESYDKNGVHIVGVGEIRDERLKRMTDGAKRVYEKALSLDCDIYHFHDPELLPYGLKLKKQGKIVVFDSHENTADAIMEKGYIPKPIRGLICAAYKNYERSVCSRLDAIVPVTPTMTDNFRKMNPNTVEVRNYPILPESYTNADHREKTIVFAGGISRQWNHHIVVQALEKLEGCRYVLCGGRNAYLDSLKELPGWDHVDYKGKIPHAEVAHILAEGLIGVALLTPGRNTAWKIGTMGNTKIFEEMLAGLPIICTDFDLWKEFVERYRCGICIDPTDPEQFCAAAKQLLDNPAEAVKMGQNGRRAVEEEFNWAVAEKALLGLYGSLANKIAR